MVVVGSGGGGLTAAICAHDLGQSVVVIEKSDLYGGTTAISGGGVWIPCNHLMGALGGSDNYDEALAYLKAATRAWCRSAAARLSRSRAADGAPSGGEGAGALLRDADLLGLLPEMRGAKSGYRTCDSMPFNAAEARRGIRADACRLRPAR